MKYLIPYSPRSIRSQLRVHHKHVRREWIGNKNFHFGGYWLLHAICSKKIVIVWESPEDKPPSLDGAVTCQDCLNPGSNVQFPGFNQGV